MTSERDTASSFKGLHELFSDPLMSAVARGAHFGSLGGTFIPSGPPRHTSSNSPASTTPLEEAILIVSTDIYNTYGRFPAHVNVIHVPCVWLQFSFLEMEYHNKYFNGDLYSQQPAHHVM
jgi:hypothetical protein